MSIYIRLISVFSLLLLAFFLFLLLHFFYFHSKRLNKYKEKRKKIQIKKRTYFKLNDIHLTTFVWRASANVSFFSVVYFAHAVCRRENPIYPGLFSDKHQCMSNRQMFMYKLEFMGLSFSQTLITSARQCSILFRIYISCNLNGL